MTEPQQQPWPTTVQRRREYGPADDVHDGTSPAPEPDVATPRHGHPADAPAASRVPSPFPRQRDDETFPPQSLSRPPSPEVPRQAPQPYAQPSPQEPGHPRPTHVRDVVAPRHPEPSTAAPRSGGARGAAPAVARDGAAMRTLRVITYVLVSLASLVFLAIVVYGGIKAVQLRDALATSPFGSLTGSSASPNAGTRPAICDVDPSAPICAAGG